MVGTTAISRPIQVPIGGLHQGTLRAFSIWTSALGAETVQRGQSAARRNFENRAAAIEMRSSVGTTAQGRPIKASIRGLHQKSRRFVAIRAPALRAETVQGRQRLRVSTSPNMIEGSATGEIERAK